MDKFHRAAEAARRAARDLPSEPHAALQRGVALLGLADLTGARHPAKLRAALHALRRALELARPGGPAARRAATLLALARADAPAESPAGLEA